MRMGVTALCSAHGPGGARIGAAPSEGAPSPEGHSALAPSLWLCSQTLDPGMETARGYLWEWQTGFLERDWTWPWVSPTAPTLMEAWC